jgi:hypothetical protein
MEYTSPIQEQLWRASLPHGGISSHAAPPQEEWLARRSAGRLGRAGVRRVAGTDFAGGVVDGALDSALLHPVETANGLAIESDPALLLFHDVSPLRRACVGCSCRLSTYRGEGRASEGDTRRRRPADAPATGRSAAAAGSLAASGARRVVCAPEVDGGRRGRRSRSREPAAHRRLQGGSRGGGGRARRRHRQEGGDDPPVRRGQGVRAATIRLPRG